MQSAELVRGERVQSGKYKIETKITKENRMKNPKSIIPDLKELGLLMLGFLPWILFLFLSGNTLNSLKIAVVVSLVACLVHRSVLRRTPPAGHAPTRRCHAPC